MSGVAAAAFNPVINSLLGQREGDPDKLEILGDGNLFQQLRRKAGNILNSTGKAGNELISEVRDALNNKGARNQGWSKP